MLSCMLWVLSFSHCEIHVTLCIIHACMGNMYEHACMHAGKLNSRGTLHNGCLTLCADSFTCLSMHTEKLECTCMHGIATNIMIMYLHGIV